MSLFVKIKKNAGNFMLDVEFETGEGVLGLLGASGCGKSMTLKCIAGIERPDEGQIVLNGEVLFDSGKRINLPPQRRKVGYLFQDYALFPNMTVLQNILCGARNRAKALEYAARFFLEGKERLYPSQLSGGEKQRVAMARMLAAEPDTILLDEPFSALDSFLKAQLEREIMNVLEGYDKPVVFVSHDRNEIYRMTDTIAVLEKGRIVDISEKHELFRAPKTLASTLLTGCKNVTGLKRQEDGTYLAVDWGIFLRAPEGDAEYRYAGFRAHNLVPAEEGKTAEKTQTPCNQLTCDILREVEDTFSIVVQFYQKDWKKKSEYSLMTFETDKAEWKQIKDQCAGKDIVLQIPEDALIWMER